MRGGGRRDPGFAYLASFVVLGLAMIFVGPALTTLRDQTGVSLATISALFVAQSIGYLAGAVLGGRGYDAGLGHRIMSGGLVGVAASLLAISVTRSFPMLLVLFCLMGFAASVLDVGGNTLMVWTRGAGVGPMMNALHFCFALGALACPLLINRSLAWSGDLGPVCWIGAAAALLMAVILLRRDEPAPGAHEAAEGRPPAPTPILLAIAGFFVIYVGVELGFAGWIYAYGEDLEVGGVNGPAWLTATFWGAFALGRLLAIPLAAVVEPRVMMLAACTVALGAAALMVAAGDGPLIWLATALMGLGVAPQFATMISFAERHVAITGTATAWFIGAAAVGAFGLPWMIGQLFERTGSSTMPIAVLGGAAATLAWFCVVSRLLTAIRPVPVATESISIR
ncbi:MAG TPA: MFS transporter [Acidimicrobiales bacterium]|nr:MFS transporter [Acidimicrobiales bacterium]